IAEKFADLLSPASGQRGPAADLPGGQRQLIRDNHQITCRSLQQVSRQRTSSHQMLITAAGKTANDKGVRRVDIGSSANLCSPYIRLPGDNSKAAANLKFCRCQRTVNNIGLTRATDRMLNDEVALTGKATRPTHGDCLQPR